MSKFGWSYPPGCSGTPYDQDYPCEVCGLFPDYCLCPECPECGTAGDPKCYEQHGLIRTSKQIESLANKQREWEEAGKAEAEFWQKDFEDEH